LFTGQSSLDVYAKKCGESQYSPKNDIMAGLVLESQYSPKNDIMAGLLFHGFRPASYIP